MDARQIITYWILCFVSIFAVVNPLRATTLTAMMTEGWTAGQRKLAVHRALLVAGAVLFSAAWIGNHVILRSNIHIGGFRIASGLLLLATVIPRMVRNRPLETGFTRYLGVSAESALGLGVTPLAFPLLCGIASIATVTLYSGEPNELWRRMTTLAALGLTLAIVWVMMRSAPRFHAFFGERGSRYATHALDLTVAAWAVDFTAIGVRDLLPLVTSTPPAGG
jgi:small neutral amino acid transporter SnatA (MarC family)